jgi:hypothetical protein
VDLSAAQFRSMLAPPRRLAGCELSHSCELLEEFRTSLTTLAGSSCIFGRSRRIAFTGKQPRVADDGSET